MSSTVLIAEDELFVAMDLELAVEEAAHTVMGPYATVREALEGCEGTLPSAAILDVRLKDGEVFPLARRLTEAGVPIIFHSGHACNQTLLNEFPDAEICSKPSAPHVLRDAIERALGKRSPAARAARPGEGQPARSLDRTSAGAA